jgi:hypothetical protein
MEIFKNLPREILSVIFVFASQMRFAEYTERLKEELKNTYSWEYKISNTKIIKINLHYFKIPQIVNIYFSSYYRDGDDLHSSIHDIIHYMDWSKPLTGDLILKRYPYEINEIYHYDIPDYFYEKIKNKDLGTNKIKIYIVGNNIISIIITSNNYHGDYYGFTVINDIYNSFECEIILKDLPLKLAIYPNDTFTQDEHEYLRYLLRNRNRIVY